MKQSKYLILTFILLFSQLILAQNKSDLTVVVGTYAYKGLDRFTAVQPIADALSTSIKRFTKIKVYDSPSQLANAFLSGEAQLIVPNLAGFAQIAAKQKHDILLFVPNDDGSTYKSSVVISSGEAPFIQRLHSDKHNIGMVWADSTSGAILGKDYLQKQLSKGAVLKEDRVTYLGRHENVLSALVAGEIEIGVLATDVFLKKRDGLTEIWRSDALPFGPVLCSTSIAEQCHALQHRVMSNPELSKFVLQHLINGWPEFSTATSLVVPEYLSYETFIKHFETSQQDIN